MKFVEAQLETAIIQLLEEQGYPHVSGASSPPTSSGNTTTSSPSTGSPSTGSPSTSSPSTGSGGGTPLAEAEPVEVVAGQARSGFDKLSPRQSHEVLIKADLRAFLSQQYAKEAITSDEIKAVIRQLEAYSAADLYESNKAIMKLVADGFLLKREDRSQKDLYIQLIDYRDLAAFRQPRDGSFDKDFDMAQSPLSLPVIIAEERAVYRTSNNIFKIVNQLKISGTENRIPDGILYINGLPLVVFEFKSAIREETSIHDAYTQLTTRYRRDIPDLFKYNAFCVISDGVNNKAGSFFAPYEFYYAWRKTDGSDLIETNGIDSLFSMINGLFNPTRLLDVIRNFIYLPDKSHNEQKILCRYPQYYAATKLYNNIITHMRPDGDGKGGTYFGATGSGKSYTMLFLTRLLMKSVALASPTIILITDRTDLDNQLSRLFTNGKKYIGDEAVISVTSRANLRDLLKGRNSGGVFLTTIHKFTEDTALLTERNNVIVISDEAHRSQVNLDQKVRITADGVKRTYGFAKYLHDSLPNATYVGFTGTPIDATLDVFGEVVESYTMNESVVDEITVRIVYEGRAAKVLLDNSKLEQIEAYYAQAATDGASDYAIETSKKANLQMHSILGDPDRLKALAADFVTHYEARLSEGATVAGKAMFVSSSRAIAYAFYKEVIALRPRWADVLPSPSTSSGDGVAAAEPVEAKAATTNPPSTNSGITSIISPSTGSGNSTSLAAAEPVEAKAATTNPPSTSSGITPTSSGDGAAETEPVEVAAGQEQKEIMPMERIKLVMTRNKDDEKALYDMLGSKEYREKLDRQFKIAESNFKIAIVVDMWLTGFDVPFLDTMYIDKPVKRHNLIQTISRVNRNYQQKEKGLIVDYIGIKRQMNLALAHYSKSDQSNIEDIRQSVVIVKDHLDLMQAIFHRFDTRPYFSGEPLQQLHCLNMAAEYVQLTEDLEKRFMFLAKRMKAAYDVCVNSDAFSQNERDHLHFYLAIRSIIFKLTKGNAPDLMQMNRKVQQMIVDALQSDGVEEIFKMGQGDTAQVDIFDPAYLAKIEQIKLPNTKIKLLQQLLAKAIDDFKRVNKLKGVDFSKQFKALVDRYNDRGSADAQRDDAADDMADEIIKLYYAIKKEKDSFAEMGIDFEEKAFYDILKALTVKYDFEYPEKSLIALARKVKVIVDDKARYTDWSKRADIKAELKVDLIMLLAENDYPPVDRDEVYQEIFEQAENFKKYQGGGV